MIYGLTLYYWEESLMKTTSYDRLSAFLTDLNANGTINNLLPANSHNRVELSYEQKTQSGWVIAYLPVNRSVDLASLAAELETMSVPGWMVSLSGNMVQVVSASKLSGTELLEKYINAQQCVVTDNPSGINVY